MKDKTRNRIAAAAAASAIGMMVSTAAGAGEGDEHRAGKRFLHGDPEYAYYGWVRVRAVVQNGTVRDIQVLEYPNDNGRSQYINSVALPYLIQETVGGRSWRVDLISGATFTSVAYVKSLQDALKKAGL